MKGKKALSEKEHNKLLRIARDQGVSEDELVVTAIQDFLKNY